MPRLFGRLLNGRRCRRRDVFDEVFDFSNDRVFAAGPQFLDAVGDIVLVRRQLVQKLNQLATTAPATNTTANTAGTRGMPRRRMTGFSHPRQAISESTSPNVITFGEILACDFAERFVTKASGATPE
jgi:hypothetical protein